MLVDVIINSCPSETILVDFHVTHNFISDHEAYRLKLKVGNDYEKMKVINSKALPIVGVSKRVSLKLGAWSGEMDMVDIKTEERACLRRAHVYGYTNGGRSNPHLTCLE